MDTIGMAIIVKDAEKTIQRCIESFIHYVDQCVIVFGGKSSDKTEEIVKELAKSYPHLAYYDFEWCDDFAAARNFSFGKLNTDWICWLDADDWLAHAEELRNIPKMVNPDVGAVWFPYHYCLDEFGNVTTIYERERVLRTNCQWVWQNRMHEVVMPLIPCKYVKTDKLFNVHDHTAGKERGTRNFKLLFKMQEENPEDKRIWLYLGHQYFADTQWMKAAEWYLKFGADSGANALERFQALCYASRALRNMSDNQAIDCAMKAIELFPQYKDGYLEAGHSYLRAGDNDKAIQFAKMSDARDESLKSIMQDTPTIIFVNPLDYTFNRYALMSEAYMKKGDFESALKWAEDAQKVRPTPELDNNLNFIRNNHARKKVYESIQILSMEHLRNSELFKLNDLKKVTPYWFRDTNECRQFEGLVNSQIQGLKSEPEIQEDGDKVTVNVRNLYDVRTYLKEIDKKFKNVKVICSYPDSKKQGTVLSQSDMEMIFVEGGEKRRLLNLRSEPSRIWMEYENTENKGKFIRFFLGRGLENWNPDTIKNVGCGGSETAIAMVAKRFASLGHNPIIYAMDNQIFDGVMYRSFDRFNPNMTDCDWFISSRVPELFNNKINAAQKWLWVHDIHCFERLTPEAAANIDVIVALSHWHVDHLKRSYPFLADAEVIDLDDQDKTYDDNWTPNVYYPDAKCAKLPRILIVGNGIEVEKFNRKVEKVPHSFIWCSSPDRGLEELLNLWPMILKELPDATLKIFYGWNYFDSSLFIPGQREFKERIRTLVKQPGVKWCNRIGQDELAIELLKADCMLYPPPHQFRETYGIAFLEAQAAGVICFYRKNGALGETINDRGVPLEMDMKPEDIVATVTKTLKNKELCDTLREKGRAYGLQRTWDGQADKVLQFYANT